MHVQMRPGSIIDDLAEAEPGYLAKQNKELRRLLVECRKELYEVQCSAFRWPSCSVLRKLGAKVACPAAASWAGTVLKVDLSEAQNAGPAVDAVFVCAQSTWASACASFYTERNAKERQRRLACNAQKLDVIYKLPLACVW